MWKICHIEMNYSHVICDNIYDYEDVSSEVQVRLNDFEMVSELKAISPKFTSLRGVNLKNCL